MNKTFFFSQVQALLKLTCYLEKTRGVFELYWRYERAQVTFENDFLPPAACESGRPSKPALVPANQCSTRDFSRIEGRAALLHALAHIEFNAINLALDACLRFQKMPRKYYEDWLLVAKEEAYHFTLLRAHLNTLGYDYGDFPAHSGLWEMAEKTSHDCLARMGCVPRLLEARGLDVAPQIIAKLKKYDLNAATLLEIIMRDEEKHVLIGNHWFYYLCKEQGKPPLDTFKQLVTEFAPQHLRKPLAKEARLRAGFKEDELSWIESAIS